jgi:hypothetical protein
VNSDRRDPPAFLGDSILNYLSCRHPGEILRLSQGCIHPYGQNIHFGYDIRHYA